MRKLTIITALLLCSCGPSATDYEKRCDDILNEPTMKAYYSPAEMRGFQNAVDGAKGTEAMEDVYDLLLDKSVDAETSITIERELSKDVEMNLSQPNGVKQEFERIRENNRVNDSTFHAENPEFGYPKYDPEDEDTRHLKPMQRVKHQ